MFFEVTTLEGSGCPCELLNADGGPGGVGSTVNVGDIGIGETVEVVFEIGLIQDANLTFFLCQRVRNPLAASKR